MKLVELGSLGTGTSKREKTYCSSPWLGTAMTSNLKSGSAGHEVQKIVKIQ